jgi:hypothetical protein
MIHRLANYTLDGMLYLSMNEFTTPEREQKVGVMVSFFFFCIELFIFQLFLLYLALAGMALWCSFIIRWSFSY